MTGIERILKRAVERAASNEKLVLTLFVALFLVTWFLGV